MRFWRLQAPDYDSDYRDSYINGSLEHPFGLPGVVCDVCGATWGGSRILPHECPSPLRERKYLTERWPIPLAQHKQLQEEVRRTFSSAGHDLGEFRPGDSFQTCYLDVPSRPRADFLWASIGSVVVSERAKRLPESCATERVAFCPVTLRKIGRREPTSRPRIPESGEPEDQMREAPILPAVTSVGPYYEMVLLSESGRAPGIDPVSVCSGCGREAIDKSQRRLVMEPSMWPGAAAFFLATTLYIIITDPVKVSLEHSQVTNVAFIECGAAQQTDEPCGA